MKVLLDTDSIALLRHPTKGSRLRSSIARLPDEGLFVSVISISEIANAIAQLAHVRKRQALTIWLSELKNRFADRLLPVDHNIAMVSGELYARVLATAGQLEFADGLIAATALCHGLHLMTLDRNRFAGTGVLTVEFDDAIKDT
jgi:predicted nucleic acid-binding protein